MLKKALDSHGGGGPRSTPPQGKEQAKLSPISEKEYFKKNFPPPAQKPLPECLEKPRPLHPASGNIVKSITVTKNAITKAFQPPTVVQSSNGRTWQTATSINATNTAVKRTSGGLAKTLSASNGFDDSRPTSASSKRSVSTVSSVSTTAQNTDTRGTSYDEYDDLDIDFDDLRPVGAPNPTSFRKPDLDKFASPQTLPLSPHHPHQTTSATDASRVPQSSPEQFYDWASSPAEHFLPPPAVRSAQTVAHNSSSHHTTEANTVQLPAPMAQVDNNPAPAKRRKLPGWQQRASAEGKLTNETSGGVSYPVVGNATTPAASNKQPWNTSASAIKEQQRNLRTLNKTLHLLDANKSHLDKQNTDRGTRPIQWKNVVVLSDEQEHVLDLVINKGKSVFFTGSAGTGKSVLLREMIKKLRQKHSKELDRIAVTASTGLAACNIGGCTLHSFAGVGIAKGTTQELVKKVKKNQKCKQRWMRAKILIIDEVSMLDAELFDKLEEIARNVRRSGKPFGGIQLVVTGDFFQLPPVPERGRQAKFAFDAGTWNTVIQHTIGLHHVFRQKDPAFANMLNEMREGRMTPATIAQFAKLDRPLDFNDEIKPTELFPTRQEVEFANQQRMKELPGEPKIFESRDGGSIQEKEWRDKLLDNCMARSRLVLKEGAQVMLIKNIDETLVNGSIGKVRGFMTQQMWTYYTENGYEGKEEIPGEDVLLRATRNFKHDPIVANFERFPLVRFRCTDGTHRDLLCIRESWKIEQPNGEVQASRQQVPLILAWALSIHKAQGQTLERVKVVLKNTFEKGQAYVALSRATSMAGLQVLQFDPAKVMAHERVRTFYEGLSRAEEAAIMVTQPSSAVVAEAKADAGKDSGGGIKGVGGRKPAAGKKVDDWMKSGDSGKKGTESRLSPFELDRAADMDVPGQWDGEWSNPGQSAHI